ncbi:MAG: hypothetical protein A2802_00975 [Candidatus Woykebacteria bacterium RIFCSPHIGHO2_01_FULL_43_29]|uniref:Transposase IS200-like domain-containing protein n=1 Tax=Candidatus Woykebacteria bacterium RIFCSPLOWO2_01_FULL_43_14 TaxID=1802605 RepID=A0A1G1WW70_9BACT|nr:MAG: hypothetical protein A2802_00975 [Candidatus Woykebacteria bacterium RIFCSPHIGHO2_01_FULL_43_29]OGY31989.1 MAG: hypothetical protein A3A61_01040 [Candidatus Woykebacteria bacterium RIFCSPLOWO2_01_FULL_43_14]
MPSKNRLKTNSENSYYHVYNRGVEKRAIFQDRQDYNVFLKYLGEYLLPKNEIKLMDLLSDPNTHYSDKDRLLKLIRLNNFSEKIDMLSYCLMPNHFHFFIKQISLGSMHKFMQSIGTRYTMYFNRKYKRVGFLYQDIYKAAEVKTDEQFVYLSKYIHKQAIPFQPSSYKEYIGELHSEWVKPGEVLSYFPKTNSFLAYQSFVEKEDVGPIEQVLIE